MSAAQKRIELRLSGLTMGPRVMDLNRDMRVMTRGKSDVDKNNVSGQLAVQGLQKLAYSIAIYDQAILRR